jgi:DNA primase
MIDVQSYITSKGIEVVRDDGSELACLCPFHANSNSPAFYINKSSGLWICFNPGCGRRGSLHDLRAHFGDGKIRLVNDKSLSDIESLLLGGDDDEDSDEWGEVLDKLKIDLDENPESVRYLLDRGFTIDVLKFFEVTYSEKKGRIVIPVRDSSFKVVGFIGRATDPNLQPKYLYSKNFPRKSVLFNLQNAKKFKSVIIVEGSLDAIRIHQAGYGNVVATLGAAVTEDHISLINRFFDEIIVFSDNDHAGFVMRDHIISGCSSKDVRIVVYDGDLKDPGEMSDDQITYHIDSSQNFFDWIVE